MRYESLHRRKLRPRQILKTYPIIDDVVNNDNNNNNNTSVDQIVNKAC